MRGVGRQEEEGSDFGIFGGSFTGVQFCFLRVPLTAPGTPSPAIKAPLGMQAPISSTGPLIGPIAKDLGLGPLCRAFEVWVVWLSRLQRVT